MKITRKNKKKISSIFLKCLRICKLFYMKTYRNLTEIQIGEKKKEE